MIICSIFDKKSELFMPLTCVEREIDIMRSLQQVVNSTQKDTTIAQFPDDFTLYRMGSFDKESGVIVSFEPEVICEVSNLLTQQS